MKLTLHITEHVNSWAATIGNDEECTDFMVKKTDRKAADLDKLFKLMAGAVGVKFFRTGDKTY